MLITFDRLIPYFETKPVTGALHIGAHAAEELTGYLGCGIDSIIWIEANPNMASTLFAKTFAHPGSTLIFCAAYNEDNVGVTLNIANNGESSSLLDFDEHTKEHPHVHFTGQIEVPANTVDTILRRKGFDQSKFNFANIDIQGAELIALTGMEEQLKHLDYVYLEVNEKHLYENCALIGDIDEFLSSHGFERAITEMTKHGWGDALYTRKD